MKAEFTNSTGMVFRGQVVGMRRERRINDGFRDTMVGAFNSSRESKLPAFVRIRNPEGTEAEIHPSRVRFG